MNPLRAIAHYYATLTNPIVPADRFTEGFRVPKTLPAITYQRNYYEDDRHQTGVGLASLTVQMTVWAETTGQAGRVHDQLRDHFQNLQDVVMGTAPDQFLCRDCFLQSSIDNTEYPADGSENHVCNSAMYFVLRYSAPVPNRPQAAAATQPTPPPPAPAPAELPPTPEEP